MDVFYIVSLTPWRAAESEEKPPWSENHGVQTSPFIKLRK